MTAAAHPFYTPRSQTLGYEGLVPCPPCQFIAREIECDDMLAVQQSPGPSTIGAVFQKASGAGRVAVRLFDSAKTDQTYAK